jgi:hypothetical protein
MRLIELSERVAQGSKNGSGRGVTIWGSQAGSVGLCPRVFDRRSRNRDRAASSVRRICSWGLRSGATFSPLNIIRKWRRIANAQAPPRSARTGPPLSAGCVPLWTNKGTPLLFGGRLHGFGTDGLERLVGNEDRPYLCNAGAADRVRNPGYGGICPAVLLVLRSSCSRFVSWPPPATPLLNSIASAARR